MNQDIVRAPIDRCPVPEAGPVLKPLLIAFGFLCVAIGVIGIVTPGLPTTVFLIMAAWAFARSSKRFHNWLYGHKRFGPVLRDWHAHRVIPPKAKIAAVTMMAISMAVVLITLPGNWIVPLIMAAVLVPVAAYILTRNSRAPA